MLALPTLLVAMDLTVLHLAVPHLSADLQPSSAELLWIVDIYGFLVAGSLITMGTLGDRIGRRRLLLAGAATFGVASVIAAFANSAGMLIATRALLGVAGATLLPSTLALIRHMFVDPKQRGLAIGVWAAVFSAGTALGPVLGGALLERFWWGSVFLIAVPAMLALLLLGPAVLPEYRDPGAGRLDFVSAALSLVGVLAVIYGFKQIAEHGVGGALSVLSIAAGLAVGVVFVLRQRVLADPLIDLQLFGAPAFSAALTAETFALFAWAGSYLFLAQYLQLVKGLSPLEAGVWLLPAAGGSVAGSMLAPLLARRTSPALVVSAGLVLAAGGFASADPGRSDGRPRRPGGRIGGVLAGHRPDGDVGHRSDRRRRAAGAGRGGIGHLRDRQRARPLTGGRRDRQHRHRGLPQRPGRRDARGCADVDLRDGPGHAGRRRCVSRHPAGRARRRPRRRRPSGVHQRAPNRGRMQRRGRPPACRPRRPPAAAILSSSGHGGDLGRPGGNSMLKDAQVATRIPVQDLDRARRFYASKLGLEPSEERTGGLLYRCGRGEFALFESAGSSPGTFTQMAFEVDDLDATVAELRRRGIVFEEVDQPGLTTVNGIAEVAGNYPSKGGRGERAAWFRDLDGNLFGIGQPVHDESVDDNERSPSGLPDPATALRTASPSRS